MGNDYLSYSSDFQKILKNKNKIKQAINNSLFLGNTFKEWRDERFYASAAINSDGTILDIGCANGFLLRCLQEWSFYKLEPYGIDVDPKLIKEAQTLFPQYKKNFKVCGLNKLTQLFKEGFPSQYRFIYWSVWDNWWFEKEDEIEALRTLLDAVSAGGRLILSFYRPEGNGKEKLKKLKSKGFKFSDAIENYAIGREGDIVAWINK